MWSNERVSRRAARKLRQFFRRHTTRKRDAPAHMRTVMSQETGIPYVLVSNCAQVPEKPQQQAPIAVKRMPRPTWPALEEDCCEDMRWPFDESQYTKAPGYEGLWRLLQQHEQVARGLKEANVT